MLKQVLKILTNKRISNLKNISSKSDKEFFIGLAEYAEKYKIEHEPKDLLKLLNIENFENKISEHFINKSKVNMNLHQLKINNEELISYEDKIIEKDNLEHLNATTIVSNGGNLESDVLFENGMNDYQNFPTKRKVVSDSDSVMSLTESYNNIDEDNYGKMEINKDENQYILKDDFSDTNDKVSTLELMLKYGMNLKQFQTKKEGLEILENIDWKADIEPLISFMKNLADFNDKHLAEIFSSCPRILVVSKVQIQKLFEYLISRKLQKSNLITLFHKKPSLFMCSDFDVEKRLEELEKLASLTKSEMNHLVYNCPGILMENIFKLKRNINNLKKELGLSEVELRKIIIASPKILLTNVSTLNQNFFFLNRTLNISYEDIANSSKALAMPKSKLMGRVKYLISLNKYQINSDQPPHVYLNSIAEGKDEEFINNIAHTSISEFKTFIETL